MLKYGEKTAAGENCLSTFKSPGNLKRHICDIHQNQSITFISCNPGSQKRRTKHPITQSLTPTPEDQTYAPSASPLLTFGLWVATPTLILTSKSQYTPIVSTSVRHTLISADPTTVQSRPAGPADPLPAWQPMSSAPFHDLFHYNNQNMCPHEKRARLSLETPRAIEAPLDVSISSIIYDMDTGLDNDSRKSVINCHQIAWVNLHNASVAIKSAEELPQEVVDSKSETQDHNTSDSKWRRSSSAAGDIVQNMFRKVMPLYEVKQSKKTPGQQRALEWLIVSARDHFRSVHSALLGR